MNPIRLVSYNILAQVMPCQNLLLCIVFFFIVIADHVCFHCLYKIGICQKCSFPTFTPRLSSVSELSLIAPSFSCKCEFNTYCAVSSNNCFSPLRWKARSQALLNRLLSFEADILCLQVMVFCYIHLVMVGNAEPVESTM